MVDMRLAVDRAVKKYAEDLHKEIRADCWKKIGEFRLRELKRMAGIK